MYIVVNSEGVGFDSNLVFWCMSGKFPIGTPNVWAHDDVQGLLYY